MTDNEKEQQAILGGGCITLIVAVLVAIVFMIAAILDSL